MSLVTFEIRFNFDSNLDICEERLSPTSMARCERMTEEVPLVTWVTPVIDFYIKDLEAFVSHKKTTNVNLTENNLFPLFIDTVKVEEALDEQKRLLPIAQEKLSQRLKNVKNEDWWMQYHKLSEDIKIYKLSRDNIVGVLKKNLTKIISFYNEFNECIFSLRVPNDVNITTDFDEFESWARQKLNLSNDYRLLTADVVESVGDEEIEHIGGLAWYRVKPAKPRLKKKTANFSDTELEYINAIKTYAETVSNLNANAVLLPPPHRNFSRGRGMAEFYCVEKEWDIIKSFLSNYDRYNTAIDGLCLFVKKNTPASDAIFINKAQLGGKVGLFIGKGGKNIKELSQRIGRRIILK